MITRLKPVLICSTVIFLIIISIFTSCTTTGGQTPGMNSVNKSGSAEPVYYGSGSGANSIEAMQSAKKDAVRKAAEDLLGKSATRGQKEELSVFFDSINDIEPYIVANSLSTVESRSSDDFYLYIGVKVDLEVLAAKLTSVDILGGQVTGAEGLVYLLPDQPAPETVEAKPAAEPRVVEEKSAGTEEIEEFAADVSVEELQIIGDYLDSLTYMVYVDAVTEADPFLTRTAVVSANRYLDKEGAEYVDLGQIEKIKEDQALVYEEETGKSVSIMQWIAHKLNADIYIELSLDANSRVDGDSFRGSANVTLNSFNASTAEGLGSAVYQTIPPAFSRVSEQDALANAVSSAVFNGMQIIVDKAENETARAAARGFKYNLILMNTSDSRLMRDFEKALSRRVRSVKRTSYSPEESRFDVFLIGDIAELESIIYDVADTIPGLDGILLIMQRGNSITFDTGI